MSRRSPHERPLPEVPGAPGQDPQVRRGRQALAQGDGRLVVQCFAKSKSATGTKARFDPQTPEFKALRTRWWTLLVIGVVLVTLSWGVRYIDKPGNPLHDASFTLGSFSMTYAGLLAAVTLGLAYACIFYALYLDFAKMRPMRLAAAAGAKQGKSAKPADNPTKSIDKGSSTD